MRDAEGKGVPISHRLSISSPGMATPGQGGAAGAAPSPMHPLRPPQPEAAGTVLGLPHTHTAAGASLRFAHRSAGTRLGEGSAAIWGAAAQQGGEGEPQGAQ